MVLAMKAAGIGPGDEVIMPAMTFIACPSTCCSHRRSVLADITYADMALDPAAVERRSPITQGLMAVSLLRHPVRPGRNGRHL